MSQAIVLAGGSGTMIKDISGDLPKSMISIAGKPLLQHIIEQCVKYNFLDIKLLVSHKREIIENFFKDGSPNLFFLGKKYLESFLKR